MTRSDLLSEGHGRVSNPTLGLERAILVTRKMGVDTINCTERETSGRRGVRTPLGTCGFDTYVGSDEKVMSVR